MNDVLLLIGRLALRSPKKLLILVFVLLVALASSLSYAAYLMISALAMQLGISRFLIGLLLAVLFARLPRIRNGKLTTIGLLPKPARQPAMLALLGFALLTYGWRAQLVPVLFLAFAILFLVMFKRLRQTVVAKVTGSIFPPGADARTPSRRNDGVIDVEFKEKKD